MVRSQRSTHTLSAPKSVSLLYAFGDSRTRQQVREAHLEAVRETVEYMEARCAQARVGTRWRDEAGGWHTSTRNVDSEGWVAAAFDHYTSRANDPQLHTHVVVINRANTEDGWRALDARRNYLHAKAGGTIYEAALRNELTRRLGVSWGQVVNGIADIEGFSPELLKHFSTRRTEILEAAEAYAARNGGELHARMLQKFTLETRQPKQHPRGEAPVTREMRDYGVGADVVAHWQQRAAEAPQHPAEVVGAVVKAGRDGLRPNPDSLTDSAEQIVIEVSDRQPVFTERDLLAHVASVFPEGATEPELTAATHRVLETAVTSGQAIPLPSHQAGERWSLQDDVQFTTRTQLEREHGVLAAVHQQSPVRVGTEAVERAARIRELTPEQTAAVGRLVAIDGQVAAIAGPGGSGKTYAIGAYADAARSAGYHVIGVAPTAAAAQKLADDLGGHWTGTIAMLTHHLDRRAETLPSGTVVICDEASMVSTKDLAHLVELVEAADGKLILLGDPHQLPSIDSGGLFHRIVADGAGVVTDLAEVNQRQHHEFDRKALHQLRSGDIDQAVFDYTEAGRVHIGHQRTDTMMAMVDAWWTDITTNGIEGVRMLAGRRGEVDMLNQLARTDMAADGLLTGPTLDTRTGMELQAGDRITVRANWYAHADLRNGQTGTITNVDTETGRLSFRRDHDGVEVVLPSRYVDQSVDYGYAQTIHTAQGHTYDRAHVYVDQMMSAELGYTALSRANGETHIWLTDSLGPLGDCSHVHCPPAVENRVDALVRQLSRSGIRPAAIAPPDAIQMMTDRELLARRDKLTRMVSDGPLGQPEPNLGAIEQAVTEAHLMLDRLGTTGARTQLEWLTRERDHAYETFARRERWIDDHADLLGEYTDVRHELDRRVSARSLLYQTNPPQGLIDELGARSDSVDPEAWDRAVAVYARARLEAGPDVDLSDSAVPHAGQWRDAVRNLQPIEQHAPVLRLTG
ncbi:hypothetical protein BH23ACT4_BH23ACT4_10740 [soil metagenome]